MAEPAIKLPIKTETTSAPQVTKASDWQPFEALRNQVDRLFHDFQTGFLRAPSYRSLLDIEPFWRRDFGFDLTPAIDIVEKDKAFEVTAETAGSRCQEHRPSAVRQCADDQGRKAGRKGREGQGPLRLRTSLWFLPPLAAGTWQCRRRRDRSELQERHSDGDPAEIARSAEKAENDRRKREVTELLASRFHALSVRPRCWICTLNS